MSSTEKVDINHNHNGWPMEISFRWIEKSIILEMLLIFDTFRFIWIHLNFQFQFQTAFGLLLRRIRLTHRILLRNQSRGSNTAD